VIKVNKYSLIILLVLIFSFSGCVEKRVIQVSRVDRSSVSKRPTTTTTRVPRPKFPREERIKEEILIRNNPNLGHIVSSNTNRNTNRNREIVVERERERSRRRVVLVPRNRPVLDVNISESMNLNGELETHEEESREPKKIIQRMEFPQEEYINLPKFGENEVSGRVYLINGNTGEEIVKSSLKLYLNPVTSYSKQWYEESYLNGNKMTPPDRRLFNYLRFTTSDDSGNFHFFGVPGSRGGVLFRS